MNEASFTWDVLSLVWFIAIVIICKSLQLMVYCKIVRHVNQNLCIFFTALPLVSNIVEAAVEIPHLIAF